VDHKGTTILIIGTRDNRIVVATLTTLIVSEDIGGHTTTGTLIGIVIAGLINMFLRSSGMSYIISFISVIVFTGLTAYDVQKLKEIGAQVEGGTEASAKMSIMGALTLYLDFINLFLALLRLFGNRRN